MENSDPNDRKRKSDTVFLYFVLCTANVLQFEYGCCLVWTSPVIPQLQSPDPEVNPLGERITTFQISLLAGIPPLVMILAPILFGKLPDVIGRKNTMIGISSVFLLANTALSFGSHIYVYYAGRSVIGLCMGLLMIVLPIYLNEICEDHNRAKHGCLMMFFIPLGSLYGFLVGAVTTVEVFTLLSTMPLIPQLIVFCLVLPESPYYTASKGEKQTTISILERLRSNKSSEEIEADYKHIETTLKSLSKSEKGSWKDILRSKASRKGFIIGLGSCLSTQMSGIPVIMSYMGLIFNNARTNMSGNAVSILVGSVKLFCYFVTMNIVEKFGRRPLLLFSSTGCGISLGILAVYLYLNDVDSPIIDNIRWLPVVSILVYISSLSLGLGSIPTAILSEFFSDDLRSVATSSALIIVNFCIFILTTAFPILSELWGVHYCIGIFSISCFFSFIFLFLMFPETRGKSFLEIQEILMK
nr:facilitated trehalose transporter Tret1-like [Leptinotarsa decemlineata]